MENPTLQPEFAAQIIRQVLNTWQAQNKGVSRFFDQYEDNVYLKEVAPGRNRGIYLLGHLIAVNDGMLPLLGLGEKLFPELETIFETSPDKSVDDLPPIFELKQHWETLNATLNTHFERLQVDEWMSRHNAISEADFAREPHRNKLNVLLVRINHQSYHLGQLNLLAP